MIAFTPGPWHAQTRETCEANARLIAAAPELYERIECANFLLADILSMGNWSPPVRQRIEQEMADIRAALAKVSA